MGTSITVENAVALMINMDFIPDGETVLSMTEAYLEIASVDYEKALSTDEFQLKLLENRMKACTIRRDLAILLKESLFEDATYTEDTLIECAEYSTDENPLVTLESLIDWAFDRFGIAISNETNSVHEKPNAVINTQLPSWENVTIKIYAGHKLGYAIGNGTYIRVSFMDIGLMGKRKLEPNHLGVTLIVLSLRRKYPPTKTLEGKHKTIISKLKKSLIQLTKLSGDPFYKPNETDGYKPKFTIIDDRRNSDERAKKEAIHVHMDAKPKDFGDVYDDANGDEADDWLQENGG
ncbi:MAG: hypothetical protein PSV17_04180 [Methylotenera sp.]|uniref:hypothetical protein n=1 Tax=Methylotenera sp. TaxID=2051956 RepID=UPI002487F564|nr:hypothetical protein [Methylotenera sp.]MDI1308617.1 hypothetical protein [Methylotenera sp.]